MNKIYLKKLNLKEETKITVSKKTMQIDKSPVNFY